ncbi:MAG: PQQ-binding-like beta-propeller repeat protein [Longimicrobiales bacterium]|nr:PQQ-binding-like beta-propeller repeat protein [Longimicrobiales bacterium]
MIRRPIRSVLPASALILLCTSTLLPTCGPGVDPTPDPGADLDTSRPTGIRSGTPAPDTPLDWPVYRGSHAGTAYSPLDAIDRTNVSHLEVAWTFRSGEVDEGSGSTIQTNPLKVGGLLYLASPRSTISALDPASSEVVWTFDPEDSGIIRGFSYWQDDDDRRLLVPVQQHVYALDADDGTPVREFGEGGRIDLRVGLGRNPDSINVRLTSPGAVHGDLLIVGSAVGEGYDAAPGHVRAYHVPTGEMRWIFHTIPHPGEHGYDTWPADAYRQVGGANAWSGVTLDEERGLAFVATGSPTFDFYGGYRHGQNLFGNSVVALDARTGERRWHFQTVHHDLWDYDLPLPPTLVTVAREGRWIDAVAQITKTGFVFVLDRETGEPLFPVEERPVPPSDVPGEEAWPTQPFATHPEPFVRQSLVEADLTDVTPQAHRQALERFEDLRVGPIFTPPSLEGTLFRPGTWGGAEWNGSAYDPETGILYVFAHEVPSIVQLLPPVEVDDPGNRTAVGRRVYAANGCSGCHGADRAGSPGVPGLTDLRERLEPDTVEAVIRGGRGAMPAFGNLSVPAMDALLEFLLSEERAETAIRAEETRRNGDEPVENPRRYTHNGYVKFFDAQGRPAVDPPWGTLTAIDLDSGDRVFRVPLGEDPDTREELQPTGTRIFGGGVVTRGGLLFIGATTDEMFRAIDKRTGEILWEHPLPAGGYATPSVYEHDGRPYVVIAAGGGGRSGTPSGDTYVAFTLPDAFLPEPAPEF